MPSGDLFESHTKRNINPKAWLIDALVGLAIAAPVFWMFGLGLGIQLPGLTKTGWL